MRNETMSKICLRNLALTKKGGKKKGEMRGGFRDGLEVEPTGEKKQAFAQPLVSTHRLEHQCVSTASFCYWNSAWKDKEVGMKTVCRLMALAFSATVTPGEIGRAHV